MFIDIGTMIWKEVKELFLERPNLRGGWLALVVLVGIFGIFMPYQSGKEWIASPSNLMFYSWIPYLLVSSLAADSFAGERERRTLETLLASRLSDRAILFGKIGAAMVYGWGITLVTVLLGLITFNVVHWQGQITLFPAAIGLGLLAISFLMALLAACLGVLISLRAPSVRAAQQTFSIIFLVAFVPLIAFDILPADLQNDVIRFFMRVEATQLVLMAGTALLVIDALLIAAALWRFQRARLILD